MFNMIFIRLCNFCVRTAGKQLKISTTEERVTSRTLSFVLYDGGPGHPSPQRRATWIEP